MRWSLIITWTILSTTILNKMTYAMPVPQTVDGTGEEAVRLEDVADERRVARMRNMGLVAMAPKRVQKIENVHPDASPMLMRGGGASASSAVSAGDMGGGQRTVETATTMTSATVTQPGFATGMNAPTSGGRAAGDAGASKKTRLTTTTGVGMTEGTAESAFRAGDMRMKDGMPSRSGLEHRSGVMQRPSKGVSAPVEKDVGGATKSIVENVGGPDDTVPVTDSTAAGAQMEATGGAGVAEGAEVQVASQTMADGSASQSSAMGVASTSSGSGSGLFPGA